MNRQQALRSYRHADGSRHEVLVHRTPEGDWQVLDTSPAGTSVVETLSGITDGRPQAEALARDYAATARASFRRRDESAPSAYLRSEEQMATATAARAPKHASNKARGASLPDPAC